MLNVSQIQWEKLMLKILCLNIFLIPLSIVIISLLLNLITLVNQIIWGSTFVVVLLLSGIWLFATPWTAARQASLSFIISWSLLNLMSIESMMPSHHLTLSHLLLPPSVFSSLRVFSSESALHIRWPGYWSFSFSISPSNEYSESISFKIDWFDLLAVQGTLKSLLQHHSSRTSVVWCLAFVMVQLSHVYVTTGEIIALTPWTFVSKMMSLLCRAASRSVTGFLQGASAFQFHGCSHCLQSAFHWVFFNSQTDDVVLVKLIHLLESLFACTWYLVKNDFKIKIYTLWMYNIVHVVRCKNKMPKRMP